MLHAFHVYQSLYQSKFPYSLSPLLDALCRFSMVPVQFFNYAPVKYLTGQVRFLSAQSHVVRTCTCRTWCCTCHRLSVYSARPPDKTWKGQNGVGGGKTHR